MDKRERKPKPRSGLNLSSAPGIHVKVRDEWLHEVSPYMTPMARKSLHSVHGIHNNNKQYRKLKEASIRMRHLSCSFKWFLLTSVYFCGGVLVWGSVCSRATAFRGFPLAWSPLLIWSTQTASCLSVWIESCTSWPWTCTPHLWI